MEKTINDKYQISGAIINRGCSGIVYEGSLIGKNDKVAIKIEEFLNKEKHLSREARFLLELQQGKPENIGIPTLYDFFEIEGDKFLVMNLLDKSLEDLMKVYKRFTLKIVLMLAEQALNIFEYVHQRRIIHRDIKPSNFMLDKGNKLYLIDFGVSDHYLSEKNVHIPWSVDNALIGNLMFASIFNIKGLTITRKDDLESLGYLLIYLLKGEVPWGNCPNTWDGKYESLHPKALLMAKHMKIDDCPQEFHDYLLFCYQLHTASQPDYNYLRGLFRNLFLKEKFVDDGLYDWDVKEEEKKD